MGRYPDLQPALPASFVKPSRTSRILQPGIVLATVVILGCMSVVALVVAGSVLSLANPPTRGANATQAFAVVAAVLSILYLILHAIAAKYNEPVGVLRPPELRLHAACFILARIVLIFWFSTFVAAAVMLSRPKACTTGTRGCHLRIADVVASMVALTATGIILTALEACKYPFQMPNFFHITKKITCRVSSFGEDFLDRSVSRASSFDNDNPFETEKTEGGAHKNGINRKPLPERPSDESQASNERPITPLLPMPRRSRSRGWGEEWTHLVDEKSSEKNLEKNSDKKVLSHSDSGISLSYDSSSGYISSSDSSQVSASRRSGNRSSSHRSSHVSPQRATLARRAPRPRVVTPSSSISNFSRRSPLSTMRYAEYPDVVVRPDLRYCPPMIPPPHEWNSSRTASMSQLIPVADVYGLQRRSSMNFPEQLKIRRPSKDLPPVPRAATAPLVRPKTSEMQVPGAYVEHPSSFDQDRNLDEHLRKIEVAYVTRRQSTQNLQHTSSVQSDRPLQHKSSIQSDRTLQHRMSIMSMQSERTLQDRTSIQSNRVPQRKSSIQSDYSLYHQSSFQSNRTLQHKSSIQSDRSLHHKTSMHSDRSSHRRSSVQLPAVDETEKRSPPMRVDSKSRYRGQKSFVHRAQTTIGANHVRPATSHLPVRDESMKTAPLRRLSLGDISPGLGSIGKMFE